MIAARFERAQQIMEVCIELPQKEEWGQEHVHPGGVKHLAVRQDDHVVLLVEVEPVDALLLHEGVRHGAGHIRRLRRPTSFATVVPA